MRNLVKMIACVVKVKDLRDDVEGEDVVNIVALDSTASNDRYIEDLYGDMGFKVLGISYEGEFSVNVTSLESNVNIN